MERVDIKTDDGVIDARLFRPEGTTGPWPTLLFYMDGLGLRDALYRMGERFAKAGYLVLMPNMFWRAGEYAPFDAKTVFGGGPDRERLMKLLTAVTPALAMKDTATCLRFLDELPDARAAHLGCVGYCLGGFLALTAAGTFPDKVVAAASIHGARLANDTPESAHLLAPKMRGEIYVGIAESDHKHDPAVSPRLEKAFTDAGVAHVIELYPGATHGFAPDDTPVHDGPSAERHYERVLALFERRVRNAGA